ncbi:V-type proton ATPase subunit S1-like [Myiozetetes cayanensis]|uniref:V-type proton ATPase subunit S1-like n=1 Tax=Myiozetetes cayanensis TaxID=478635 RepID=UPI00215FCE8C|nr:V-type proton ATPase subunit S1-like [Myiozetetes cayanensis]
MAALWVLWALAGVALGPGGVGAAERVPLLVWSTERSLWPPLAAPPGGRVVSEEQLEELLTPGLIRGPRTVLLFLQDQLSLEDFTAFGGVFGNEPGRAFTQTAAGSSLVLPGVSGGALGSLPLTLQRALGAPPLRLPGGVLGGLRLNRSDPALLVVGLPHSLR